MPAEPACPPTHPLGKLMNNFLASLHTANNVKAQRAALLARLAVGVVGSSLLLVDPATAQTLKQGAVSIFNYIYGLVGVGGALAVLITFLNWTFGNWFSREDPKKTFLWTCVGVVGAFSAVAIVQFLKETFAGSASNIGNL